MKLVTLRCPNCGASLEIDNGIDTFFCMHCGHKIVLDNQSRAAIEAKVKIKGMEHEERLVDKRHQQERYKMEFASKEESKSNKYFWIGMLVFALILAIGGLIGRNSAVKLEQKLQSTVNEIMIDIASGNYASAYVKANSLYWDSEWTSDGEEKWNATRKTIIKQIQKAEKAETGTITYEDSEGNWFTNLFK